MIQKTLSETQGNYRVYTINAMEFRKQSLDCQEFGDYGIHSWYPKSVPANEIWVSDTLSGRELQYAIDSGIYQSKEISRGVSEHRAYLAAERKEKVERLKHSPLSSKKPTSPPSDLYIKLYTTLIDSTKVFLIDEELVQDVYKQDFVEGGNHSAYSWVPDKEIWIDSKLHTEEIPYIIIHEYTEMILMRDKKLNYSKAHKIASKVEFKYRCSHTYSVHVISSILPKLSESWVLEETKNLI